MEIQIPNKARSTIFSFLEIFDAKKHECTTVARQVREEAKEAIGSADSSDLSGHDHGSDQRPEGTKRFVAPSHPQVREGKLQGRRQRRNAGSPCTSQACQVGSAESDEGQRRIRFIPGSEGCAGTEKEEGSSCWTEKEEERGEKGCRQKDWSEKAGRQEEREKGSKEVSEKSEKSGAQEEGGCQKAAVQGEAKAGRQESGEEARGEKVKQEVRCTVVEYKRLFSEPPDPLLKECDSMPNEVRFQVH